MSKQVKKTVAMPRALTQSMTARTATANNDVSAPVPIIDTTTDANTTGNVSTVNTIGIVNTGAASVTTGNVNMRPPTMNDLIMYVANAYIAAGWNVMVVYPIKGMTDIIAKKSPSGESSGRHRFHFVQVVPQEARDTGKFIGQQKNEFIQNALSNQADPIHAVVTTELKRGEYKLKLSPSNPNTNTAVRL